MTTRSKKKRPHSPLRRMQKLLSNLRLWSWESDYADDGTRMANIEVKLHPMTPYKPLGELRFLDELVSYPFNWKVCCRVLCTNGTEDWIESCEIVVKQTRLNALENIYAAMKEEAMSAQQNKQIVDVGWIAQTFYNNPDFNENWLYAHQGDATEARQLLYKFAQKTEAA